MPADNGEMMKQPVLFVAHCVLNTASKVTLYDQGEIAAEESLRRRFVRSALDAGLQLIQLPCPEFTLYGPRRWGHTSNQFDNIFFRGHCRKLIGRVLDEAAAYLAEPDRFEVLGFVGIDGSPSCGVDYTCTGPWGGSPSGRDDLDEALRSVELSGSRGIFFDELGKLLAGRGISLPCAGLYAPEPDKVMNLIRPGFGVGAGGAV
jgi:predicted secreted protein